jgi:hypothetical protein
LAVATSLGLRSVRSGLTGPLTMEQKRNLGVPVLTNGLANVLARRVRILSAPRQDGRVLQLELGLDLKAVHADGTAAIPVPATPIVDPDGTVRWVGVPTENGVRSEPSLILATPDDLACFQSPPSASGASCPLTTPSRQRVRQGERASTPQTLDHAGRGTFVLGLSWAECWHTGRGIVS